jgi:hypothetical protein
MIYSFKCLFHLYTHDSFLRVRVSIQVITIVRSVLPNPHPHISQVLMFKTRRSIIFCQQLGKINSDLQKKSSNKIYINRSQIEMLTERHEQEEIDLIKFHHGSSTLVVKNSRKVV